MYRPELDLLRFLAFLAVFVVHDVDYTIGFFVQHGISQWAAKIVVSIAHAGMYGVDVFFVLSSYLITELLLRERALTKTLNVGAFYVRRVLRIWPLYYFFMALAALTPFLNPHGYFSVRYVLPCLFLMGNWGFIWFGLPRSIVIPLWSVSVEEQFYLVWAPVVARLSRRQIVYAAVALIAVANFSRIVDLYLGLNRGQVWVSTFSHLDSIAAGILVAVLWRASNPFFNPLRRVVLFSAAVCCVVGVAYFDFGTTNSTGHLSAPGVLIGYPVVALASAAILLAFLGSSLRSRPLEYLGRISYGLYIYHLTAILVVNRLIRGGGRGPVHAFMVLALALGLTIAMGAASYSLIEKPFLRLKRRFTFVSSRPV